MGLCNAPETLQTLINNVFHDYISKFLVVYISNLLIYSRTKEEHLKYLRLVFERLRERPLCFSPKKCQLMTTQVDFRGLLAEKNEIRLDSKNVEAIKKCPKPSLLSELRGFLGIAQFFRMFIKGHSSIAEPLKNLNWKDVRIGKWNSNCDSAFYMLQEALVTALILIAPYWDKEFQVYMDGSSFALGATLTQLDDNKNIRFIECASRKLTSTERNYTSNDHKMLGLLNVLQEFRCYLGCLKFTFFVDNQVFSHFYSKPNVSRREGRWLEILSSFNVLSLCLKPGRLHVLGDALSRIPASQVCNFELLSVCKNEQNCIFADIENDQAFGPIYKRGYLGKQLKIKASNWNITFNFQ